MIIRDNRGKLLAGNLSSYLAGIGDTPGTPIDPDEISRIVNRFLPETEQLRRSAFQISQGVFKRFTSTDIITNRTQIVTSGIWSGDLGSLLDVYTSSVQVSSLSGKYYIDCYHENPTSASSEVQFSIAYGDINGFGSPSLQDVDQSLMASRAVYTQFRNVLLSPGDRFFSVYSGSTAAAHNLTNFYAININRARYKERLDPGNISIKLQGAVGTVNLIDDSGGTDENVTTAGRVYNLVSGSLNIGSALTASIQSYTASNGQGWGLFYPDMGILILNPAALAARVDAGLTAPTSQYTDDTYFNNKFINSGSRGLVLAIDNGADFQARRTENVSTSHYFVRANNREYNFSNNPTFVTGSIGQFNIVGFERDPRVYITSVGLYNDASELLAVAKLSTPVEKTFDKEISIKVKLDF
jgi:hypothetical protein